jgi:N utilization substance protein B
MLSRRYLRIKVMQSLYAFFTSGQDNLNHYEKQLLLSLDKLYDLFIYKLSLFAEIIDFAASKLEEGKLKFPNDGG